MLWEGNTDAEQQKEKRYERLIEDGLHFFELRVRRKMQKLVDKTSFYICLQRENAKRIESYKMLTGK